MRKLWRLSATSYVFVVLWLALGSLAHADNLFFYRNDGVAAIGRLDPLTGTFSQTQTLTNLSTNWSQIVPVGAQNKSLAYIGYSGSIFFYRAGDGAGAIATIQNGNLVQTDTLSGLTPDWNFIVSPDSISNDLFFYRRDGTGAVGRVVQGKFRQTQSINAQLTPNWSMIVPCGARLFFYRTDGLGAVASINQAGNLEQTDSIDKLTPNWTKIVCVGNQLAGDRPRNLLFYRKDGQGAIAFIDNAGKLRQTQSLQGLSPDWSQIVEDRDQNFSNRGHVLFYSAARGAATVAYIDTKGELRQTHQVSGFARDWSHIVSHAGRLFFYRPDSTVAVARINDITHKYEGGAAQQNGLSQNFTVILNIAAN